MAGSWNHFVDDAGRFDGSGFLENDGDVVEALREAYGMVWWLANQMALARQNTDPEMRLMIVEWARQSYKGGLRASPGYTWMAAEQNINHDGAWGDHKAVPGVYNDEKEQGEKR